MLHLQNLLDYTEFIFYHFFFVELPKIFPKKQEGLLYNNNFEKKTYNISDSDFRIRDLRHVF